jgi:hypothetical protein
MSRTYVSKRPDATSQPLRRSPHEPAIVISAGSRRLFRTVEGVTRVYDLADEISVTVGTRRSACVVTPEPREWNFYGSNGHSAIR